MFEEKLAGIRLYITSPKFNRRNTKHFDIVLKQYVP